jgi:hypothetical protein
MDYISSFSVHISFCCLLRAYTDLQISAAKMQTESVSLLLEAFLAACPPRTVSSTFPSANAEVI